MCSDLEHHSKRRLCRSRQRCQVRRVPIVYCNIDLQSSTTLHRYNGTTRGRILDATGQNYLSGFSKGTAGVAFHGAWLGNTEIGIGNGSTWLLSADQIKLYRANGGSISRTSATASLGSTAAKWTINAGSYSAFEPSDWACACIIHYNRELTLAEIEEVEAWAHEEYRAVMWPPPLPPSPPSPPPRPPPRPPPKPLAAEEFVSSVEFVSGPNCSTRYFERHATNLNHGTDGAEIFMCLLRDATPPFLTNISVVSSKAGKAVCPAGTTQSPDMNAQASNGNVVYVCMTYTNQQAAPAMVKDLVAVIGANQPCPASYQKIPGNLNDGWTDGVDSAPSISLCLLSESALLCVLYSTSMGAIMNGRHASSHR